MNKTITYYGQFSLAHWISMILNGQIKCPDFQRILRWTPLKALNLIDGFYKGTFVPPVIIAQSGTGNKPQNIVIDGQQRLTAITLMYLGYWPKDYTKDSFSWQFNELQKLYIDCNGIEALQSKLETDNRYVSIKDLSINRSKGTTKTFFKRYSSLVSLETYNVLFSGSFLGFSYVKFFTDDEKKERELCAKTFAQINTTGVDLVYKETRKALYVLIQNEDGGKQFNFMQTELYKASSYLYRYDFMRLCAFAYEAKIMYTLGQERALQELSYIYEEGGKQVNYLLADGLINDDIREQYIVDYITNAVFQKHNFNNSQYVDEIDELPETDQQELIPYMENYADRLSDTIGLFGNILDNVKNSVGKSIESFVGFDSVAFGYIFWCIFMGRAIDTTKIDELCEELSGYIENHKGDKSSNAPVNLRGRLTNSIETYKNCLGI